MATTVLASIGDHGALNATLPADLQEVWIDRDLSWLDFNERVLAEALDERTPLLERAKFLAIFTSNLDLFFMEREAVLRHGTTDAQRALLQQLRDKLLLSLRSQAECYRQVIVPGLAEHGLPSFAGTTSLRASRKRVANIFKSEVSRRAHAASHRSRPSVPFSRQPLKLSGLPAARSGERRIDVRPGEGSGNLKQWISLESDLKPGQKLLVPLHEVIRGNLHKPL